MPEVSVENIFLIFFRFRKDFLERGREPLEFFQKLEEIGVLQVIPHGSEVPVLSELNPKELYLYWTLRLVTPLSKSAILRILLPLSADKHNEIRVEGVSLPPPDPLLLEMEKEKRAFSLEGLQREEKTDLRKGEGLQEVDLQRKKGGEGQNISKIPKIVTKKIQVLSSQVLFRLGENLFSVEFSEILEPVEFTREQFFKMQSLPYVEIQGELFEILSLYEYFCSRPKKLESLSFFSGLLIERGGKKSVLFVDEILTMKKQVSFKQVEGCFKKFPGIKSASLWSTGELVFALDLPRVLDLLPYRS